MLMIASLAVDFDIHCTDFDRMSLLHIAGDLGRESIYNWLLGKGADPLLEDRFGRVPKLTVTNVYSQLKKKPSSSIEEDDDKISVSEDVSSAEIVGKSK